MATKLNDQADRKEGETLAEGSIGWIIAKYKETEKYTKLAAGTLKYYNRYLNEIAEMGKTTPFSALTRRDVIDFVESFDGEGEPRKVAAVLRNLYNVAMYYQFVPANLASDLRLATAKRRDQFWLPENEQAWLKAAADHTKSRAMRVAFSLLIFTAQRPGDVLAMGWTQYNGDTLKLRQEKTRKLLEVPCHSTLRAILDEERKQTASTLIVTHEGRGLSYPTFNRAFAEISLLAGIDGLQARDLRRTAMIRMAEASATEAQISAVSGHSIESTRQILETYLPRTVEMARGAITRLERGAGRGEG